MNCPNCNSVISDTEIICPYCAMAVRSKTTLPLRPIVSWDHSHGPRAKQHPDYLFYTLLAILAPPMGPLYAFGLYTRETALDKILARHTLLMSVIGFVIWMTLISIWSYYMPGDAVPRDG